MFAYIITLGSTQALQIGCYRNLHLRCEEPEVWEGLHQEITVIQWSQALADLKSVPFHYIRLNQLIPS